MFFIIQKLPNVKIAISINLNTIASPLIIEKLAFIEFAFLIDTDSLPIFFLPLNLAKINLTILFDKLQVIRIE